MEHIWVTSTLYILDNFLIVFILELKDICYCGEKYTLNCGQLNQLVKHSGQYVINQGLIFQCSDLPHLSWVKLHALCGVIKQTLPWDKTWILMNCQLYLLQWMKENLTCFFFKNFYITALDMIYFAFKLIFISNITSKLLFMTAKVLASFSLLVSFQLVPRITTKVR